MTKTQKCIRNIAIVAHVDHGKTTLIDKILRFTETPLSKSQPTERIMDSNKLERERGITIFSKLASVEWKGCTINLIDTPGHADFGGEVERVLSMADGFLLLVDASEGPMPQTRFVTQKALEQGLKPIVVINKVDKPNRRIDWVLDQTLELFIDLDADDTTLEFPVIYTSAIKGECGQECESLEEGFAPLLEGIIQHIPEPAGDRAAPLQLQISQTGYNSYTGVTGIGRVKEGTIKNNQIVQISSYNSDGSPVVRSEKVESIMVSNGLDKVTVEEAGAGHIVTISGLGPLKISDTICDIGNVVSLPPLKIDEPTVSILLSVNDSPFAGLDGKYLTSRHIWERLNSEKSHNIALQVSATDRPETFLVSGRGELHLSILLETMRREGFEVAAAKPKVIFKEGPGGRIEEPYEELFVEIPEVVQGTVMAAIGERRGVLHEIKQEGGAGRVRLKYIIPSRGLLGFRNQFLTLSSGSGTISSIFLGYDKKEGSVASRKNGVLISNGTGKALAYALFNLQPRGHLMIEPGAEVYEGQVIGLHTRDNDLTVNCLQNKKLTNVRASGKDTAIILTPPMRLTLEQALEFIEEDELLEITPSHLRIRKKYLKEGERKRMTR